MPLATTPPEPPWWVMEDEGDAEEGTDQSTEVRRGIPPQDGSRRSIPYVTEPSRERLTPAQIIHYRDHRRSFIDWMDEVGKNPQKKEGYAHETVRRRAQDTDQFYRWVWDQAGRYTTQVTPAHADGFIEMLVGQDYSESALANVVKSFKALFRWRDKEWDSDLSFDMEKRHFQPRDYLSRKERELLREASREYASVPEYDELSSEDQIEYANELAKRFRKPAVNIGRGDFQRANGAKVSSLVHASLDAALRPIEVARARVSWVDTDNKVLRIPYEEASKDPENWTVALRTDTAQLLDEWIEERERYAIYDDTNRLWLTRDERLYSSRSLGYLLEKLCDKAGIDTVDRSLTWYALRRSTATYLAREDGLEAAAQQLRHKSTESTVKYDVTPPEERREALEKI